MSNNSRPENSREAFCMISGTSMRRLNTETGRADDALRKLSVEYISPHDLKLDPNNPRTHSAKQIRQIARSIETFGFNVPAQVDSGGTVVAGHGRVLAARKLELPFLPVIRLEHLTAIQLQAFAIADNKLTENAE
jgi:ParB-like chromosome segregation protein Spo0J